MARIGSKDTRIEVLVRRFLFNQGLRFRKNVTDMPGTPDIVIHKYKKIIFVHGCFWHGHENCAKSKLPDSNSTFWQNKISTNIVRDKENRIILEKLGWKVINVWQCELGNINSRNERFEKLLDEIIRS